jgi:hypothetical protein
MTGEEAVVVVGDERARALLELVAVSAGAGAAAGGVVVRRGAWLSWLGFEFEAELAKERDRRR